jgi:hypothetical protein
VGAVDPTYRFCGFRLSASRQRGGRNKPPFDSK